MTGRDRRAWSRAEKARVLRRCKESGLSLHAFARKVGMHSGMLYRWRRELKKEPTAAKTRSLVPVRITTATLDAGPNHPLEVVLRNGKIVRVLGGFDEEVLQRLVEVLERC